ncbi:MAG: exodeoxyribonuclease VII small subunit [Bacteroidota bacterium]
MKPNYSKAYNDLLKLVDRIEDDEIQLDVLASKVKQAKELIEFCENSLRGIETEVNDELTGHKKNSKERKSEN